MRLSNSHISEIKEAKGWKKASVYTLNRGPDSEDEEELEEEPVVLCEEEVRDVFGFSDLFDALGARDATL